MSLSERMGELLGPKPLTEIVITLYDDEQKTLNFQFEGFGRVAPPSEIYQMLSLVAQNIEKNMVVLNSPEEAPIVTGSQAASGSPEGPAGEPAPPAPGGGVPG